MYVNQSSGNEESLSSEGILSGIARETELLALIKRTGYALVQANGQRKYGGPPPNWVGERPGFECEVFIGSIPRTVYEDRLIPVFEAMGMIYEFRLMMEFSGENRGFGFCLFATKDDAKKAVRELKHYGVRPSLANRRLFIGGLPTDKKPDDLLTEMKKITDGVEQVVLYPSVKDKSQNRGFAFVEYKDHQTASLARRKLIPGSALWSQPVTVDWATPENIVDEEQMDTVKVLFARNLMSTTTEEKLMKVFTDASGRPGSVERVKKLNDYAFIHFGNRVDALHAMVVMNGSMLDNSKIEVVLSKPPKKNRKKTTPLDRSIRQGTEPCYASSPYGQSQSTASSPYGESQSRASSPYGQSQSSASINEPYQGKAPYYQPDQVVRPFYGQTRQDIEPFYATPFYGPRQSTGPLRGTLQDTLSFHGPKQEAAPPYQSVQHVDIYNPKAVTIIRGDSVAEVAKDSNVLGYDLNYTHCPFSQMLLDYCSLKGLQLLFRFFSSTAEASDGRKHLFFMAQVSIPELNAIYTPSKYGRTREEAKSLAAQYVIMALNIHSTMEHSQTDRKPGR